MTEPQAGTFVLLQLVWGRNPEQWTPEGDLPPRARQGCTEGATGSPECDLTLEAGGQFEACLWGAPVNMPRVGGGHPPRVVCSPAMPPALSGASHSCVQTGGEGPPARPAQILDTRAQPGQRPVWLCCSLGFEAEGEGLTGPQSREAWEPLSFPLGRLSPEWAPPDVGVTVMRMPGV